MATAMRSYREYRAACRASMDIEAFFWRQVTNESDIQANAQLQRELSDHVQAVSKHLVHAGVRDSPLYTDLPVEIRHQIFSYIVCVPESIHVFPVKGNSKLGYRLSRCGDSLINVEWGTCNCESSFRPPPTPPEFVDTQLLLVSKTVRREVLDLIFVHNRFTFTSVRDLANFTDTFTASASKMQHIRLYQRLSDHSYANALSHAARVRSNIGQIQSLKLSCYLDDLSHYEEYYHDGFIEEILPLAFPRLKNVKIVVQTNKLWRHSTNGELSRAVDAVQKKLEDVFAGKWEYAKDVPRAEKPKKRVPECEKEPLVKRGILALGD